MDDHILENLCEQINQLCEEHFIVVRSKIDGLVTLYNGGDEITEDTDKQVHRRLRQIAKENGISMMLD